ncbi:MAG: hypothetical protein HY823_14975 [Acidobacteria bacterium]|nr:hypothetical protein [Acidobacteriota bacterium]
MSDLPDFRTLLSDLGSSDSLEKLIPPPSASLIASIPRRMDAESLELYFEPINEHGRVRALAFSKNDGKKDLLRGVVFPASLAYPVAATCAKAGKITEGANNNPSLDETTHVGSVPNEAGNRELRVAVCKYARTGSPVSWFIKLSVAELLDGNWSKTPYWLTLSLRDIRPFIEALAKADQMSRQFNNTKTQLH